MSGAILSFAAGSACLSSAIFVLCVLGWATAPALLAVTFVVGVLFLLRPVAVPDGEAALHRRWTLLFWAIAIPFAVLYLVNAAAPEISPDGSGYHLGFVRRYLNHRGFYRITTDIYASFPQALEMLFLPAYALGRHSAAALVHCVFLLLTPLAMVAYGRQFRRTSAAVIAALLFFVAPVAGIDGTSAYIDVGLSFAGFACFFALELWDARPERWRLLLIAGLLAGFCFGIKYTGAVAILYALAYVAFRGAHILNFAAVALPAACMAVPWLIKNWIVVANPFSPFLNRLFPNPYVDPAFEQAYRAAMSHFAGVSLGPSIPLEVTLRGGLLQGNLGPAFLLVPLALLAARDPRGRRALAAATLFALPWLSNIGTRFLLPSLPFFALAMGITLAKRPRVAAGIVVLNAVFCWPAVLSLYCAPSAWRLTRFPVGAALRLEPEHDFILKNAPDIRYAWLLQDNMPPAGVVYTAQPIMEAYTDRTVLIDYRAALNSRVDDLLKTAIHPELQPSVRRVFRFPSRATRSLRVSAANSAANWVIYEFEGLPVGSVRAQVNPWNANWSRDGSLATSWQSWQTVQAGAFIQFDFAAESTIGSFAVRTRPGPQPSIRIDAGDGLSFQPTVEEQRDVPVPPLRALAIEEISRLGITHLAIHDSEPLGPDIARDPNAWELKFIAAAPPLRLYEIVHH